MWRNSKTIWPIVLEKQFSRKEALRGAGRRETLLTSQAVWPSHRIPSAIKNPVRKRLHVLLLSPAYPLGHPGCGWCEWVCSIYSPHDSFQVREVGNPDNGSIGRFLHVTSSARGEGVSPAKLSHLHASVQPFEPSWHFQVGGYDSAIIRSEEMVLRTCCCQQCRVSQSTHWPQMSRASGLEFVPLGMAVTLSHCPVTISLYTSPRSSRGFSGTACGWLTPFNSFDFTRASRVLGLPDCRQTSKDLKVQTQLHRRQESEPGGGA